MDRRITLFSYGSGLASSMFSFTVRGSVAHVREALDLRTRLSQRIVTDPSELEKTMELRERRYGAREFKPDGLGDESVMFWPKTWVLRQVDDKGRRRYGRVGQSEILI